MTRRVGSKNDHRCDVSRPFTEVRNDLGFASRRRVFSCQRLVPLGPPDVCRRPSGPDSFGPFPLGPRPQADVPGVHPHRERWVPRPRSRARLTRTRDVRSTTSTTRCRSPWTWRSSKRYGASPSRGYSWTVCPSSTRRPVDVCGEGVGEVGTWLDLLEECSAGVQPEAEGRHVESFLVHPRDQGVDDGWTTTPTVDSSTFSNGSTVVRVHTHNPTTNNVVPRTSGRTTEVVRRTPTDVVQERRTDHRP